MCDDRNDLWTWNDGSDSQGSGIGKETEWCHLTETCERRSLCRITWANLQMRQLDLDHAYCNVTGTLFRDGVLIEQRKVSKPLEVRTRISAVWEMLRLQAVLLSSDVHRRSCQIIYMTSAGMAVAINRR
jgi:hypothetical protein